MSIKKSFLITISLFFLTSWATFSSFQSRLYCEVTDNQITIFTKKESWLKKCSAYLDNLNILLQQKYDEILLILQYQKDTQDKDYRSEVYETKKTEFSQLMKYKSSLLQTLQSFEDNFLLQYQNLIAQPLATYLEQLIQKSLQFEHSAPHTSSEDTTFQQIQQQIKNVQAILSAQALDDIISQIPNYLYLKSQLEKWK